MPEEVKFTEEELTQVQNIQKSYVNVQNQFWQLKLAQIRLDEQEVQLEDTLKQGDCKHALSDQFGNASLLKSSLRAKDLKVTLYQRPRAESNIAVACASILARHNFVSQMDEMSEHYKITFPKGSTKKSLETAVQFVKEVGKEQLHNVAKLHFNVTQKLEDELKKS